MSSPYLHGTDPEEQQRLSRLNDLLNQESLRMLELRGDERILDVGSGLGQLSRAMARAAGPDAVVVGVERSTEQLVEARRQARQAGEDSLVEFRHGDAVALPLSDDEWGSFDVVHARFILEHVRDPAAVVRAMVRAACPGGRIILEDDDHAVLRLWPEPAGFPQLWQAYIEAFAKLGYDPFVGRRLVELLHDHGAEPARNHWLFFGSCSGDASFQPMVMNFVGILQGARQAMLQHKLIGAKEFDVGIEKLRSWGERAGAALWYSRAWAEGRVPGPQRPSPRAPERERTPRQETAGELTLMRFLAESVKDLNSTLKLEKVFQKIGARIQSVIDCQLFAVLLYDEETGILEHSYSLRHGEHRVLEGGLRLGQGIGGTAAQLRRVLRVPDVRQDPRYVRVRHTEVEIRSELAVPLLFKDRLIGVLDLESTELDAFTPEHETVVTTLASHIAIALENARLYGRVLAEERRLEDDLETAREIQKGLLPSSPPRVRGAQIGAAYLPAKILGGDFFDFLSYGKGRLALVVGDVSGKAAPAALYGSLAVGEIRGHALEHSHGPAEMLETLNESLLRPGLESRFVAMAFAVYDPAGPSLTLSNSGFPRPQLVRDGKVTSLQITGVPLGLLPDRHYDEIRVELRAGDIVAFCSDGVQEPADAESACFESERLAELLLTLSDLTAVEIAEAVLRTSDLYLGEGREPPDDRTVVILKVTGEDL